MAGLLDWITGAVQQQYAKGAPYREAVSGLLQGDATKFGLLAQEFNRKAQTPEGALDVALNFAPMGILSTKPVNFYDLASSGKINMAKSEEQEVKDLLSGKSKFAELRLNWDDPKTYNLEEKLSKKGFKPTLAYQGADQITYFSKSPKDIEPILSAKTPYEYGKAYGYSDADIARFYKDRYGDDAEKMWMSHLMK